MTPDVAVRSVIESVVRHPECPSPKAASRTYVRHQQQHLFGGARDGRDHHDGQRDTAGERREMLLANHDQRIGPMPITIDGTPFSTSAVKRTMIAKTVRVPYSAR